MGEDSPIVPILAATGGLIAGAVIGGLIANALRPHEQLRETVEDLRQRPIFPVARPVQRVMDLLGPKRPPTVLEALCDDKFSLEAGGDPTLLGHRIDCQGRSVSKPMLVHGTGSHRAERVIIHDGLCSANPGRVVME